MGYGVGQRITPLLFTLNKVVGRSYGRYPHIMLSLQRPGERGITAVIGTPDRTAILELITQMALVGRVHIIVGGNRFDGHTLARTVRRHTTLLDETLARIEQTRPFTCIQAISLLERAPATTALVMLDMLDTFYDESISDAASVRLGCVAAAHLRRLGQTTPVLVTLRPPPTPARVGLIKLVRGVAHRLYVMEPPPRLQQPSLF